MNVLWICTDQQRYDTLGCYGNPFVKTPNLDRLAQMGVRFQNAYSQSPVCAPSRASFLTGRYPRTCGVRQNGQDIPSGERLLPKILSEQGYTCGLSGKLHISACMQTACKVIEPRIDDGYDYFRWSHHPAGMDRGGSWPANEYSLWLTRHGQTYQSPARADCKYVETGMPEEWSQTKWCTDCALEYMDSAHRFGIPWLFSVNFFDPHHSFNPPKEYLNRYLEMLDGIPAPNYVPGELDNKPVFQRKDHEGAYNMKGSFPYDEMSPRDHKMIRAAYWAMIDLIDVQVGRMLDYLEQSGQLHDTLILFTSDHGENLGDHGMYLKGPYFYEQNVHVPLIAALPGRIPGGRVSSALVELTDLAPTILEAAGFPAEPGMQGKSFWKLLTEEQKEDYHRDSVYAEFYNSNLNHRDPLAFLTMVYDGRYKFIKVHQKDQPMDCQGELYDLHADPAETVNQYENPVYADIKTRMLELLCDRMAQTCDPLPVRKSPW